MREAPHLIYPDAEDPGCRDGPEGVELDALQRCATLGIMESSKAKDSTLRALRCEGEKTITTTGLATMSCATLRAVSALWQETEGSGK